MARIFAALLLPQDVSGHLDEYVDAVRSARPDLRWVPPSRWHLTLDFLGECGPHEVDRQIVRWERRAARSSPMRLHLAGAGTFPKTWMASVLWTGLGGDVAAWAGLAAFDQEPHVTVARTREPTDLTGAALELGSYVGPAWIADRLAIVESHVRRGGERGPRYEPIELIALGGQDPSSD